MFCEFSIYNYGCFQCIRYAGRNFPFCINLGAYRYLLVCKALASLDYMMLIQATSFHYFNPQGSREPRRLVPSLQVCGPYISIHKALASLDQNNLQSFIWYHNFNPQGSREPRRFKEIIFAAVGNFNPQGSREPRRGTEGTVCLGKTISIHKALASLDCLSCM